jgi:hypothetical protein
MDTMAAYIETLRQIKSHRNRGVNVPPTMKGIFMTLGSRLSPNDRLRAKTQVYGPMGSNKKTRKNRKNRRKTRSRR